MSVQASLFCNKNGKIEWGAFCELQSERVKGGKQLT